MADNSPAIDKSQRHRYRILLGVEAALLALSACLLALQFTIGTAARWPLLLLWVPLCLWHVVAIPVILFYLAGNPIVISLRYNATAESTAFRREARQRPALTDEQFYARFYQGSTIPEHIPARVRHLLRDLDSLADRLIPTDNINLLLDDDFVLEFEEIEREFGVRLTEEDYALFDGTLGNLILFISQRTKGEAC
jgi:hypothetical protein